jgi:hypothetical protein
MEHSPELAVDGTIHTRRMPAATGDTGWELIIVKG